MSEYVNIGRIAAPHGVRGWVKVIPLTDDPNRFSSLKSVFIASRDGTARRRVGIEGVNTGSMKLLLKFDGIESPEAASALKGFFIQVSADDVPPITEEDTYYHFQLEGMRVFDDGGGLVGELDYVFTAGGGDVYVVRAPDGKGEYMIPALKRCIRRVDVENKVMVVDREWLT